MEGAVRAPSIKPLTRAQYDFLRYLGDPNVKNSSPAGSTYFWFHDKTKQRWLHLFESLGLVTFTRHSNNAIAYAMLTEKGWEFLHERGIETMTQYRARRRAEMKAARLAARERREAVVNKNLADIDDFLTKA